MKAATTKKRANAVSKRREPTIRQMLAEMVRRIVAQFDPDRIILFGSYARGEATRDSDVDLLVIMQVRRAEKRQRRIEIRCALYDIPVAKDILVVSPDEFTRLHDIVGTIPHEATKDGRTLYARSI